MLSFSFAHLQASQIPSVKRVVFFCEPMKFLLSKEVTGLLLLITHNLQ